MRKRNTEKKRKYPLSSLAVMQDDIRSINDGSCVIRPMSLWEKIKYKVFGIEPIRMIVIGVMSTGSTNKNLRRYDSEVVKDALENLEDSYPPHSNFIGESDNLKN